MEITVLNEEEKEGSVTSILPRRNSLIRPAVANVDQAFLIFAMENPKPNFLLLDRFLIMMEQQEIPAVICFNKKDVGDKDEMEKLYEIYTGCGYRVVLSSTYEGEGMDEIREILKGKTTVVAGPSGVGKSSLINALGGVEYDVDREIKLNGRVLHKGVQRLDGQQVLDYCRARKGYGTDVDRADRQQRMLFAIFTQLREGSRLTSIPKLYLSVKDYIYTDLTAEQIAALAVFGAAMVWLHYQQLCSPGGGDDPYTSDLGQHL